MLALSVFEALRNAMAAARLSSQMQLDAPTMAENALWALGGLTSHSQQAGQPTAATIQPSNSH